jgi:hypothetical protein
MKNLQYTTIANDHHTIQVSTWMENGTWHFKMAINGTVIEQGVLPDEGAVHADKD